MEKVSVSQLQGSVNALWDSYLVACAELSNIIKRDTNYESIIQSVTNLYVKMNFTKNENSANAGDWSKCLSKLAKENELLHKCNLELQQNLTQEVQNINTQTSDLLHSVQTQKERLEGDSLKQKDEIYELKKVIQKAQSELSVADQRAHSLESERASLTHENEQMNQCILLLQSEMKTLKQLNTVFDKELDNYRKKEEEEGDLRRTLEELNCELEAKSELLNQYKINTEGQSTLVKELQKSHASAIRDLHDELAQIKKDNDATVGNLQEQLTECFRERGDLEDEVKRLTKEKLAAQGKVTELAEKYHDATKRISEVQQLLGRQTSRCVEIEQKWAAVVERETELQRQLIAAREKCALKDEDFNTRMLTTEKRIRSLELELEKHKNMPSLTMVPLSDHEACVMLLENQLVAMKEERDFANNRFELTKNELCKSAQEHQKNEEPTISQAFYQSEVQSLLAQMREQETVYDMAREEFEKRIQELERKRTSEDKTVMIHNNEDLLYRIATLELENNNLRNQCERHRTPLSPNSKSTAMESITKLEKRILQLELDEWSSPKETHLRKFDDRLDALEGSRSILTTCGSPLREVSIKALDDRVKELEAAKRVVERVDPEHVNRRDSFEKKLQFDDAEEEREKDKVQIEFLRGELTNLRRALLERERELSDLHTKLREVELEKKKPISTSRVATEVLEKNKQLDERLIVLEEEKKKLEAEKRLLQLENKKLTQDRRKERKEKEDLAKLIRTEDTVQEKDHLRSANDTLKAENQKLNDRLQWLESVVFDKDTEASSKASSEVEALKEQVKRLKQELSVNETTASAENSITDSQDTHKEKKERLQYIIDEKDVQINVLQAQVNSLKEDIAHIQMDTKRGNDDRAKREKDFHDRVESFSWLINTRPRMLREMLAAHTRAEKMLQVIGDVDISYGTLQRVQGYKSFTSHYRNCATEAEEIEQSLRKVMATYLTQYEKKELGLDSLMFQLDARGCLASVSPLRVYTEKIRRPSPDPTPSPPKISHQQITVPRTASPNLVNKGFRNPHLPAQVVTSMDTPYVSRLYTPPPDDFRQRRPSPQKRSNAGYPPARSNSKKREEPKQSTPRNQARSRTPVRY